MNKLFAIRKIVDSSKKDLMHEIGLFSSESLALEALLDELQHLVLNLDEVGYENKKSFKLACKNVSSFNDLNELLKQLLNVNNISESNLRSLAEYKNKPWVHMFFMQDKTKWTNVFYTTEEFELDEHRKPYNNYWLK